jgi:hypothetical protein
MSRRQQIVATSSMIVATSSMEAEYIAAYYAAQDIVWFRGLLQDLDLLDSTTRPLFSLTTSPPVPCLTTQFTMPARNTST